MSAPDELLVKYLQLFLNGRVGYLTLWTRQNKSHVHFADNEMREAALHAGKETAAGRDVYIRANVQGSPRGTTAATVSALTAFSIDFDVAGPGHKTVHALPASTEDLEIILKAANIPLPTVTLFTGGGLCGIWALETPLPIGSEDERNAAKDLSRRFQGRIAQFAKSRSMHIDPTFDLVRACRLPGTRNYKPAYGPAGVEVTVHSWTGNLLSAADIDRVTALFVEPAKGVGKVKSRRERSPGSGVENDGAAPIWPAIYAGCDALSEWADTIDGLPEPQWYALSSVVGACRDGRAEFHALSEQDHRYSAAETDQKLDHALEASAPRLCASIRDLGGNCSACPFANTFTSPIGLGYVDDPVIVELARRWVYVADQDGFIELPSEIAA